MRIASFDIGKKNLAFYVEEINTLFMEKLQKRYNKLLKKDRLKKGGVIPEKVSEIMNEMFINAKHVKDGFGVFDIRKYNDNILDVHVRANLYKLLESYMWLWQSCDVICIEQQFYNPRGSGSGANMDAIKIGECLFSWFVDNYYPFKVIEYFGSQYKTQLLGAPHRVQNKNGEWKPMTKQGRKDWSVEKAEEIFLSRGEKDVASIFTNAKKGTRKVKRQFFAKQFSAKQKMDDIADCVIQCQAYKFKKIIAVADYREPRK